MKILIIIIMILFLGTVGFFAFNQYIYNQKQGSTKTSIDSPNMEVMTKDSLTVMPIAHASMVLQFGGQVIYNDPTGGKEAFAGQPDATIILVSDIHGDHFDAPTLKELKKPETILIVPQAVFDLLPPGLDAIVMQNGGKITQNGIEIEAIPMYNVPESANARHTKGRGNGYILSVEGKRVYIAGDTGPTAEMKALQNVDVAFVPMNPPFTMTVEEAADAVLSFKPKVVYPYHYRGQQGLSDIDTFKQLVERGNANISVQILNFYPEQ